MAPPSARVRLHWHGDFLGEGSLARLNRNLARALVARGEVELVPCGEPTAEVERALGLPPRRIEDVADHGLPRVTLQHGWPVRFLHPASGHSVQMQPWEFGPVPLAWVAHLRDRVDDVWCNSTFVRDCFAASGLPPERLHVLPEGFDPAVYHPGVEPLATDDPRTCVFLFVGALLARKNIPKLIEAYLQAFAPDDDVVLLIKRHAGPGMHDEEPAAQLRALAARRDIPRLRFLEGRFSDGDMARLYRTATALVHPYRGEGFGLPILEAMACGVPVVVTAGGSTDDFVDDRVGYPVLSRRVALGRSIEGLELAGEGWWLEASLPALVAALRRVAHHRDEAAAKGRAAAERAHAAWTWDHAAQHVVRRLDALVATPGARDRTGTDVLDDYAENVFTRHGEDGILRALFARLRVVEPCCVEIGAGAGDASPTTLLVRQRWKGVRAAAEPANVCELLQRSGVPTAFDLLVLGAGEDAAARWEAVASYAPRVVVRSGAPVAPADAALAARLGYALLASDPNRASAFFLRAELLPHVGFARHRLP